MKLMKRKIPNELLSLLEKWLSNCWTCVKWNAVFSRFLKIDKVRQGSVLSPQLFAIYLDDVASCLTICQRHYIVLYADDILIIASSLTELQRLVNMCEIELCSLDMLINAKKSACMRVDPICNIVCSSIAVGNQNLP